MSFWVQSLVYAFEVVAYQNMGRLPSFASCRSVPSDAGGPISSVDFRAESLIGAGQRGIEMETQLREPRPKAIIRLSEVLRRTGFSRSTLYIRIAKGEFPHQVSLGARSVGWVEAEVEAWIAHRANMRPADASQVWLLDEDTLIGTGMAGPSPTRPVDRKLAKESSQASAPKRLANNGVPDLAQLELVGTKVYVDKKTGTLWFQVLRGNFF